MRRAVAALALALALGAIGPAAAALPSAAEPNAPGTLAVPFALSTPPALPEQRSYEQLLALWQQAGAAYGVPWQVLAAVNKIESNFGRNMGPSSAGAIGWMQFIPSSWFRWGMDGSGDGIADPWNPEDAVYSAARYLAAAGAQQDLARAIFAYNHANWYVDDVLELGRLFGGDPGMFVSPFEPSFTAAPGGPEVVFELDDLDQRLDAAQSDVAAAREALAAAEAAAAEVDWRLLEAQQRAGDPALGQAAFLELEAQVTELSLERDEALAGAEERRQDLADAVAALDDLRAEASEISFTNPVEQPFASIARAGGYVFPVAGGPGLVSVSRFHRDYPAADIAAPAGSTLYALTDGVVLERYDSLDTRCGIGFKLQTTLGAHYVYCHLGYLEPDVLPGAALTAGAAIGLVGSTGHSTGPHLHLQLDPAVAYPQEEPWFQGFSGTAFSWQEDGLAEAEGQVLYFTR